MALFLVIVQLVKVGEEDETTIPPPASRALFPVIVQLVKIA